MNPMIPRVKIVLTAIIVLAAAACVQMFRVGDHAAVPADRAIAKGSPAAPVWIVEYVDLQCAVCRMGSAKIERFMTRFPGRVYLQERLYPLAGHEHGATAALYARCAARRGKYWEFTGAVFSQQAVWSDVSDVRPYLRRYASEAGLNPRALEACAGDPAARLALEEETKKAKDIGVRVTPTYFINGKMAVGIAQLEDELTKLAEKAP